MLFIFTWNICLHTSVLSVVLILFYIITINNIDVNVPLIIQETLMCGLCQIMLMDQNWRFRYLFIFRQWMYNFIGLLLNIYILTVCLLSGKLKQFLTRIVTPISSCLMTCVCTVRMVCVLMWKKEPDQFCEIFIHPFSYLHVGASHFIEIHLSECLIQNASFIPFDSFHIWSHVCDGMQSV